MRRSGNRHGGSQVIYSISRSYELLLRIVTIKAVILAGWLSLLPSAVGAQFLKERSDKVHVVFLPGIYGSKLRHPESHEWHWGETTYGGSGLSLLEFPEFETELMDRARFKRLHATLKDANIYSDFTDILEWSINNVHSFHYDWRKSNQTTAVHFDRWLCDELRGLELSVEEIRLLFIAHSMGGLVLRHWLKDFFENGRSCSSLKPSQISKIIFAGTPHLGSQEAVNSLVNGESSLTENWLFFMFNGDGIVRDAVTFESVYELLPSHNIIDDSCDARRQDIAQKLVVQLETGEFVPFRLGDVSLWKKLGIPKKQPYNSQQSYSGYSDVYDLISDRLSAASKTVCSLLRHAHPQEIAKKFQFVYGTNEGDGQSARRRDTIDVFKVIPGGRSVVEKGLGDKTVPEWSAYPLNVALSGQGDAITDFTPVGAQHDQILSNGLTKNFIGKMLRQSARIAAVTLGEVFERVPTTKEELKKSFHEFGEIGSPGANSTEFKEVVKAFQIAAQQSGVSAEEFLEIATDTKFKLNNRIEDSALAVGYTVASELASPDQVGLKHFSQQSAISAFDRSELDFSYTDVMGSKVDIDVRSDVRSPEDASRVTLNLLRSFSSVNLQSVEPDVFSQSTVEIAQKLKQVGLTGPQLYQITNEYDGLNRYELRALGFATSSKLEGWDSAGALYPAYQNTAHAFSRLNIPELAAGYGIVAGIVNDAAEKSLGAVGSDAFVFQERARKARSVASWGLSNSGQLTADSFLKTNGFSEFKYMKPNILQKYGLSDEVFVSD